MARSISFKVGRNFLRDDALRQRIRRARKAGLTQDQTAINRMFKVAHHIQDKIAENAPSARLRTYINSIPWDKRKDFATSVSIDMTPGGSMFFNLSLSTYHYRKYAYNPAFGAIVSSYGREAVSAKNSKYLAIPVKSARMASKGKDGKAVPYDSSKSGKVPYPGKKWVAFAKEAGAVSGTGWITKGIMEGAKDAEKIMVGRMKVRKRPPEYGKNYRHLEADNGRW